MDRDLSHAPAPQRLPAPPPFAAGLPRPPPTGLSTACPLRSAWERPPHDVCACAGLGGGGGAEGRGRGDNGQGGRGWGAGEAVRQAVGGSYCRLQVPLSLTLGVRKTVAGHRLRALQERGGGGGHLQTQLPAVDLLPLLRRGLEAGPLLLQHLALIPLGLALVLLLEVVAAAPDQLQMPLPEHLQRTPKTKERGPRERDAGTLTLKGGSWRADPPTQPIIIRVGGGGKPLTYPPRPGHLPSPPRPHQQRTLRVSSLGAVAPGGFDLA